MRTLTSLGLRSPGPYDVVDHGLYPSKSPRLLQVSGDLAERVLRGGVEACRLAGATGELEMRAGHHHAALRNGATRRRAQETRTERWRRSSTQPLPNRRGADSWWRDGRRPSGQPARRRRQSVLNRLRWHGRSRHRARVGSERPRRSRAITCTSFRSRSCATSADPMYPVAPVTTIRSPAITTVMATDTRDSVVGTPLHSDAEESDR